MTTSPPARSQLGSRLHLLIAAAIPIVVASACGGDSATDDSASAVTETVPPQAVATATVTAETSTSTATTTVPEPLELSTVIDPRTASTIGYAAEPATYLSDRLGVEVEVTLEEPLQYINLPGHVSFASNDATGASPYGLFIHEVIGFVPPENMATPRDGMRVPDQVDPFTGSFDDWFGTDPRVVVTAMGTDSIAGAPAPWWEFEVDPSGGETFRCLFGDCVTFIVDPKIGSTNLGDDWRFRLWHLTSFDHATIVAFMESTDARWDDTLAMANRLLTSLRITGDGM